MKALITAGTGSPLHPLTQTKNKHLLELANKPLIFHAIEKILESGIKDIALIVKEDNTEIQNAVGDGSRWNIKLTYIPQRGGEKGIAHAIYCSQNFLKEDSFMVYLGDNIINQTLKPLIDKFENENINCLLALCKVSRPERFGVPEFNGEGQILRVEERPIKPKSPYAVAGIYFYDKNIHKSYPFIKPSFRGSYEVSDLHTWLAENGYNIEWKEIKNWWKDRGSSNDLLDGNALALKNIKPENDGKIERSVEVRGKVAVGKNTKIDRGSVIRGPVVIGQNCLIKNSYIGPYTSIGNKVELHGVHIENSIIYEGTAIATEKQISSSIIGPHCTISNAKHETPKSTKLIISENSSLSI